MFRSITETLKKINIELKGGAFISIISTLSILSLFVVYKISSSDFSANSQNIDYQTSAFLSGNVTKDENSKHFIYASKRGKKYYYYNCKSSIKEENKIYFDNDEAAQRSGYTLSKTCK